MNLNNFTQCAINVGVLFLLARPLGLYMARVYEGRSHGLGSLERFIYRLCGVDEKEEMPWQTYAVATLMFSGAGILAVYLLQRVQNHLPFNPMAMGPVSPDSSFNTAVSFATNTNWQSYGGETTMSFLTQMLALTVQNFVSAATGMAVLVALIRGFVRTKAEGIGNFWVDMVRGTLYILLPLSVVFSLFLVWQGVPQTFRPNVTVSLAQATHGPDGKPVTEQVLAMGPVASQEAIKMLGTNGGGFFNVNSSHPYENPTPFTNFVEVEAILLIAVGLCFTFGRMVGKPREGRTLLAAMTLIFVPLLWLCVSSEQAGNPAFTKLGVDQSATAFQPGGNMEGKEVRFGVVQSAFWATATTAASNGSVNAMHDSFTPLGGLVPMVMMKFGEVVYGGVGTGLYGMLVFALIAVFMAGLMVGRTPEYLGKKIDAHEVKMASVAALIMGFFVLLGAAVAVVTPMGKAGISNPGAHGFSEILYAFTSAANNNGSAFAGLSANTPFYNGILGITMFFGRFWVIIPVLAIAGSLAKKKLVPAGPGTLPTDTALFTVFLVSVVVIVGALCFFPSLSLGPIVEHCALWGI